jgi:S1-C subfamily serine protease
VVNLADGFLQTRAFIDEGSSGGPVINADGDIVSVVSQGGGAPDTAVRADVRPKAGGGHEAIGTAFGGGVVELAKTRRVQFLRDDHAQLERE